MAVEVMRAGLDQCGPISIAAEVGDAVEARLQRAEEKGMCGAHRQSESGNAIGVDVVPGGKIVEGRQEVAEYLETQGADPIGGSPADYARVIKNDYEMWRPVILRGAMVASSGSIAAAPDPGFPPMPTG